MPKLATLWKGFRFGMLLQLAVGPICLFVLLAAFTVGFWPAMGAVLAVTLTDVAYIALSSLGAAALLGKPSAQRAARLLGGAVLCLFGLDMLLGALGIRLLPGVRLFAAQAGGSVFWQALFLTASNPLTVLFWGGALTAKVAENGFDRRGLLLFASGCVLSTAVFLTAVAALGGTFRGSLDAVAVDVLNAIVGLALIGFGIRLMLRKDAPTKTDNPSNAHSDAAQ